MSENWQDNPKLAGMDHAKLDMLQQIAQQGAGKSPTESSSSISRPRVPPPRGKNAGLHFNANEIDIILEVLKAGKYPQECAKLDQVVNLMKMIR